MPIRLHYMTEFSEIGALAYRNVRDGHAVTARIGNPDYDKLLDGLVPKEKRWWRQMGQGVVFVFDGCNDGDMQDWLRGQGELVVGGTAVTDELENDRQAGQKWFKQIGFRQPESHNFKDIDAAMEFIKTYTDRKWILKQNGDLPKSVNHPQRFDDGADMVLHLEDLKKRWNEHDFGGPFDCDLMEMVEGMEIAASAFFNGEDFLRNSDGSIAGFLNWEHKKQAAGDQGETCYDDRTEVLTENGFRLFRELGKDELVAQVNPKTLEINYVKPLKFYDKEYSGPMIKFKTRLLDALVTPTHNMWASPRHKDSFRFVSAAKTFTEAKMLQAAAWKGKRIGRVHIPSMRIENGSDKGRSLDGFDIDGDTYCRFMGIYIAEGSTTKEGKIYVSQFGKNQEKIKHLFDDMPIHVRQCKVGFVANSVQLVCHLKRFGAYARFKEVPKEIKDATPEQIRIFLDAFNLGDGDVHGGQRRYSSTSKKLIDDIQEMLVKIGIASTMTESENRRQKGWKRSYVDNCRTLYSLEERKKSYTETCRSSKTIENYTGRIYCVKVPTHLLVVRRNGRVLICGNTGETGTLFYGCAKKNKLMDQILGSPEIIRVLKKAGYRGVFDINGCLLDSGEFVGFEPTCRFGVPATDYEFIEGIGVDPAKLLLAMAAGKEFNPRIVSGWGMCMVVVAKPFPVEVDLNDEGTSVGEILWARSGKTHIKTFSPDQLKHIHLENFRLNKDGRYEVATKNGYLLTATGTGSTIKECRESLCKYIDDNLFVDGMIYRPDIGKRVEDWKMPK